MQKVFFGGGICLTRTVWLHQCFQHLNLTPLATWQFFCTCSVDLRFISQLTKTVASFTPGARRTLLRTNPVRRCWNHKHRVMIADVGRGSGRPQQTDMNWKAGGQPGAMDTAESFRDWQPLRPTRYSAGKWWSCAGWTAYGNACPISVFFASVLAHSIICKITMSEKWKLDVAGTKLAFRFPD